MPLINKVFKKRAGLPLMGFLSLFLAGVVWLSTQSFVGASKAPTQSSKSSSKINLDNVDPAMLKKKLDQIQENEEKILSKFETLLKEINVVKIRATIR